MLVVMHLLTRSALQGRFEWRRLAQLTVVLGGVAVAGELLLPTRGAAGFLSRAAVFAAIPLVLLRDRLRPPPGAPQARALLERASPRSAVAGGGRRVSRPTVSVVMPFAGDSSPPRRGARALLELDTVPATS